MENVDFLTREAPFEDVSSVDMNVLDLTSLTDVKDIITKFAGDRTFAPREVTTTYDSELGEIDIDSDVAPEFGYDFENVFDDENARANSAQS